MMEMRRWIIIPLNSDLVVLGFLSQLCCYFHPLQQRTNLKSSSRARSLQDNHLTCPVATSGLVLEAMKEAKDV